MTGVTSVIISIIIINIDNVPNLLFLVVRTDLIASLNCDND